MIALVRKKTAVIHIALLVLLLPGLCFGNNGVRGMATPPHKAAQAKNIILFIGDGMQLEHEIAYSRYLTGEDFGLVWNNFDHEVPVATWDVTTYNRYARDLGVAPFAYDSFDPMVGYNPNLGGFERYPLDNSGSDNYFLRPRYATDSASSATAMATGYKTDDGRIAWLSGAPEDGALKTIAEIVRDYNGGAIGVVSTVPFSHATPAAFVSHNVHRNNYFTGRSGYQGLGIADEIIQVIKPEVVIGGGHPDYNSGFMSRALYDELQESSEYLLVERLPGDDGGQALLEGARQAAKQGKKLFGLFGGAGGNFEPPLVTHDPGHPSVEVATIENPTLADATLAALEVLSTNEKGFFLMVEQGDIDWANHANDYFWMMGTMHDLHEAVKAAVAFVNRNGDHIDWSNTLLLVTSDHGNSYMRLNPALPMGKGVLPTPSEILVWNQNPTEGLTPKVTYGTGSHTNELTSLYAQGAAADLLGQYEGFWYPGTRIIDNTHIFEVMREFALDWEYAGWRPGTSRKPFLEHLPAFAR
ncbi:alkaline phosphatase [Geoalkalibacter halelectricus]|uniref:Alkaline phosphatase n=1 Tax=Geoalkalibacter halelectricus TaxID=2847045 RepID=A0ABY5ZPX3_9BACT|nr:alkaline phosphatase [Geoalkalibacter halelectricus]MDO3376990.1 alkaline phosphatase [Geoalkalibacter halelectricus]UWZ81212.1 alkaline phosphatase [Geoalkalibacter halelectricus]